MEASSGDGGDRARTMRRVGPVLVIGVLVLVVGGLVVFGGDSDDADGDTDGGGGDDTAVERQALESVEGVVTFSRAADEGIAVDWPETCDTDKGRVAIPSNFAAECVAPYDADELDNGGATSTGVTADTIRIVYYQSPPDPFVDAILNVINADDTPDEAFATLEGFVEIYETYYETYGRDIELIRFQGTATSLDEVAARSDAVQIAEELQPFMVWGGPFLTDAFSNELAAKGVLNLSLGAALRDGYYADESPFLWSILITPEQTQVHLAEYLGRRLAGEPAIFAGDQAMQSRERVFGRMMLEVGPDVDYLRQQFTDELSDYDVEWGADLTYSDPVTLPNVVSAKIAQLKEAGVTTVVLIGDPLAPGTFTQEATAQEYFPEWVIAGGNLIDTTTFARTYDQQQWVNAFGPSSLFARGVPEASFAYHLYDWYHGSPPPADSGVAVLFPYPTTTFAGIQGAGPDLTPESYRTALFNSPPVPGGLTNPAVSFGDQGYWDLPDHAALDDMTEIWWDPGTTGPDERGVEGAGMYQYIDGGVRYLPGEWPDTVPRAFDPEGAVALYESLPDTDAAGDYPSPAG